MSSVYVLFRYHSDTESYRFLHKINLTEIETENVSRYGSHIMYIETIDVIEIIELYLEKPKGVRKIEIEENDYDSDSSFGSEIFYDDDLIEEIETYANENIHLMWIDPSHQNCYFRRICGCGCDELHDGWSGEFCDPYPIDVYTFNNVDMNEYEDQDTYD